MRSLLRSVVGSDPSLEIAGTAADGASALAALPAVAPDLILLDVEMPVMDGLVTLRELRRQGFKMPVIMCSSLTQRGAKVTIEALACGASDYVTKPVGQPCREIALRALTGELIPRIRALTQADRPLDGRPAFSPAGIFAPRLATAVLPQDVLLRPQPLSINPEVVVIGVSTGGPAALDVLLPALPATFPLPILVVQHMPELFTGILAERLGSRCRIPVCEAAEGQRVTPGTVVVARGNWHMEVLSGAHSSAPPTLHLSQSPPENHCRPAVDVLFRSAARHYGAGVLAVVLTGMGSDGLNGCRMIREHGGGVLAQDRATSTVWGMPGALANAGLAHRVLPLDAVAPEILRIVSRAQRDAQELRKWVV
jgi:two-component system chemotaxis response regulator CheB